MKKKYNIVIINNGLAGGGIERASTMIASYFANIGHDVTIIALYKTEHFFKIDERVKFIEPTFERHKLTKIWYLFKVMNYLRHHIKEINPATVLSYGEWTNPFVIIALLKLKVPVYLSDRMSPDLSLPIYNNILKKIFYRKASGIIAQTKYAKEIISNRTRATNIAVIPNPINVIEKKNILEKNIIVTVGRLNPEKGHHYLLEAFASLKKSDWSLSIVGNGDELDNLKKLAIELGINNQVVFHGHLYDFSLQLSEAKIFVLPSLQEGFPNALLEAMSLPLSCISTTYLKDSSDYAIENLRNGLLVKPGDSADLARALQLLVEDEALRLKLAAEAYKIRDELTIHEIGNKYLSFITDIL